MFVVRRHHASMAADTPFCDPPGAALDLLTSLRYDLKRNGNGQRLMADD